MELLITWSIAIGVSMPYVMGSAMHGEECYSTPVLTNNQMVIYACCWVLVGWGIPLVVITVLSVAITRVLRQTAEQAHNDAFALRCIERNRKVFKMFIMIVLAFFLLTMPYSLFYAVGTYLIYLRPNHTDFNTLNQANYALFVLMVANSCINPIIYAKMHKDVNKFSQRLWSRFKCRTNALRNIIFYNSRDELVLSSVCKQASANGTIRTLQTEL